LFLHKKGGKRPVDNTLGLKAKETEIRFSDGRFDFTFNDRSIVEPSKADRSRSFWIYHRNGHL